MPHAVLAILSGHEQSVRCADALKLAGFSSDEISILLPDEFGAQELGYRRKTRALEGIAVGVISGAALGASFALMASYLQFPFLPLAPVLAAGPLWAALATAALFALVLGLSFCLIGLTLSEYIVHKFDRKTKFSSSLIAIHADNAREMKMIEKILRQEGAKDVRATEEETDRHKPVQLPAH